MNMDVLIQGKAQQFPKANQLKQQLRTRAVYHCRALDLPDAIEISLVLCDNDTIQQLNAQWRQEDKATDVLSFPMFEDLSMLMPGMPLGDIVISLEYAQAMVEKQTHRDRVAQQLDVDPQSLSWQLEEEVEFLFIHGLLHLVGHDHLEPEDEAIMKQEEVRLWRTSHATQ